MKESTLVALKEATKHLSSPQYFLETSPGEYNALDYFIFCRGPSVQGESTEKRLQNEWRGKLIPKFKESEDKCLRETGARLEKLWRLEKRSLQEMAEQVRDEHVNKKYKQGLRQAYQEHQLQVVQISSQRLEKDLIDILDGSPSSATGSLWSRTPSPVPFPSLCSVQSTSPETPTKSPHLTYKATTDQSSALELAVSPKSIVSKTFTKDDVDAFAFFNKRDPKDILFDSLQDGKRLPQRIWNQPDYNFVFQLGGLDLGDKITMHYNDVRKQTDLDHTKVDRIALMSGIVHICDGYFGLSSSDTTALHNAVVDLHYSKELADADIQRARNSEDIWSTWIRAIRRLSFTEKADAKRQGREPRPIDTAPIMDEIMSSRELCKDKDILPVFYIAMNVFRKFSDRAGKLSETEWMTRVIVPFLEEFMGIQHDVTFACTNSITLAGQERKANLNQDGQTRQPDVIGRCTPPLELYYGELKPKNPRIEDSNTDRLRIAIFTKDSLDQLDRKLVSPPPVVSFQAIGGAVTFYIGAKVDNVIVHSKLSTITLPSQLGQLDLHEETFYALFQVLTLIMTANAKTRDVRESPLEVRSFPTLGTPERLAMAGKTPTKGLRRASKQMK
ncbi:hypothetical protein BGZ70_002282 [Mortierella alpina]|uniref:Uncharacterized protein n=1 Tax=Mortierella alpina TaxID=64518 RepID=A0A9P6LWY4_MORAP|nr:hypothetical protein BGZ70_002282 [Mortierella alpina]